MTIVPQIASADPDASGSARPRGALSLAVVIPTFNERPNIEPLLAALDLALAGRVWEAVYVDDNSRDGTPELIEQIARTRGDVRLIRRVGRRGLSSAVVEGMLATVAPIVAVIDADMQHDEAILPKMVAAIEQGGADMTIGTRYAQGGSTGSWDKTRKRISVAGTGIANRIIGRSDVSDPLSGFFALRRSLLVDTAPKLSSVGFKILVDLIASAPKNTRIAEVPYTFRSRHAGTSKLDAMVSVEFALLLADKLVGRWLPPRLLMFLAVGAVGLVVNMAVLLTGLNLLGWNFWRAEVAAVVLSIISNFTLNNMLTYRDRQLRGWRWLGGLASFTAVCGIGAAAQINFSTLLYGSDHSPWFAGVAGATAGALWNYAASSFLTWNKR